MAKIIATDRAGLVHTIEGRAGVSVMINLKTTGRLPIAAICGGTCACATCHVYVDQDWLGKLEPQDPSERELVGDSAYYQPNSRLSCQIEFSDALDGLRVTLAPED
jgi:2Fe-2S ferredoxin